MKTANDETPAVVVVRSKYFTSPAAASPGGGVRTDAERKDDVDVDDSTVSPNATSVTRHDTLASAVDAAEDALETYLTTAKRKNAHDAHEAAAHGFLRHFRGVVETFEKRAAASESKENKDDDVKDDDDAFDEPTMKRVKIEKKEENWRRLEFEANCEESIARAGNALQNMLQETHRLHVNASCRVKTRAPRVGRARDALTAIRREARTLYKRIDPEGYARDRERVKMLAMESQAALDIQITKFDAPPKDLRQLRAKCPVMASTGSPHHLCAHLCYYREYEPARQMFVLRCRAAEARGTAEALDGWRAELAVRPIEDVPAVNRSRADPRGTASGACSLKHLPWMVEFVSPTGERFKDALDVLNAVDVECDSLSWPRASHGGNGVREARVSEDGLSDQTELLRAALWKEEVDGVAGTTPVRRSFTRITAGGEDETRTPLRLAPDPLAEKDDDDDGENGADDAGGIVVTAMRDANDDDDDENTPGNTPLASPCVVKSPARTNPTTCSPPDGAPEPVRHWWAPPLSPFGLLEEILWQDEWKLLVACMMLNCTTRLQVDRVLWRLFLIAPTAADAVRVGSTPSGFESLERVIAPLGLHRKRTNAFIKLSIDVEAQRASNAGRKISNVSACHGVGVYASDAHALFVDGVLAGSPRDHALRWYHAWAIERRSRKSARRDSALDNNHD